MIRIILYLNCANSDIESAEEKLRAGAWASVLDGEHTDTVPRSQRKQALRSIEGAQVFDIGYRIGGRFKRSYSGEPASRKGDGKGTTRGYGKRRAHWHHYWIGPRDGVIADDIMSPGEGERGLVLYWQEATEIHPELRDDRVTVIPVED